MMCRSARREFTVAQDLAKGNEMELRYNVPAGAKYICKSQAAAGLPANLLTCTLP